jgi:hypothetical protein
MRGQAKFLPKNTPKKISKMGFLHQIIAEK